MPTMAADLLDRLLLAIITGVTDQLRDRMNGMMQPGEGTAPNRFLLVAQAGVGD